MNKSSSVIRIAKVFFWICSVSSLAQAVSRRAVRETFFLSSVFGTLAFGHYRARKALLTAASRHGYKMTSCEAAQDTFSDFVHNRCSEFVENEKKSNGDDKKQIRFVMGNEAGDLDSIVSALTLSYVHGSQEEEGNILTVPLVSINREDMPLRRDAVLLLSSCGFNISNLLYLDDDTVQRVLLENNQSKDRPDMVLTDHNHIKPSLSHLSDNVVSILDHHDDLGCHPCTNSAEAGGFPVRDIAFQDGKALVGSTCTLVAERLLAKDSSSTIDPCLSLSLLGTIILDTLNMNPAVDKGTPRDLQAITNLVSRTQWDKLPANQHHPTTLMQNGTISRESLLQWLRNAKIDPDFWSQMSVLDCLRIDYKRFHVSNNNNNSSPSSYRSFGLSSILLPLSDFSQKPNFIPQLFQFLTTQDIPLLGVLSMTTIDDKPRREILLLGEQSVVESMTQFLLHDPDASLLQLEQMREIPLKDGYIGIFFRQRNIKASRKQVAPVMLLHWQEITGMK